MPTDRISPKAAWSSRSVRQGLALILIPALLVIGIQAYLIIRSIPEISRFRALGRHNVETIAMVHALERAIRDAERGQRGFVITGDSAYLGPYITGAKEVTESLAKLTTATAEDAELQRRWPVLEQQIGIKLAEMKTVITVRQEQGFDAAKAIVETNRGADAMRAIVGILDAAEADENDQLNSRRVLIADAERATETISLIGGAIALVVAVIGTALVWSNFRRVARSERALTESEEKYRGLLESAPDAVVVVNEQGRVVLVNTQAERTFGYSRDELVGETVERLIPDRFYERNPSGAALEHFARRKDGSEFPVEISLSPRQTPDGVWISSAIRDISQRKEAESALAHEIVERQRAEETLRQAQKMSALGQLTGGIAHDFNNMLGVILGSLEILQRRLKTDDPRLLDPIRAADHAAERSAALTRGLLAFSRLQALDPKPTDANKLVTGMSGLLHRTLGERIAIETVLAAGLWTVLADVNQLENALLNLAVNARDAMPDGGKLTIETGNAFFDEAYANAHAEVVPGQYVMIAVSDTGAGMSEETIEKAFEPFFTTKETGQGTGLGLSQVYGFVKQSAGHIKIYSEIDHGTTVKVYLPRHTGLVTAAREEIAAPPMPARQRSETILVVEDNELLLASVTSMLLEQGYRVLEASNGAAALEMLTSEPEIHLLFTDVVLPGNLNGRQLADEARRRRPNLLVLFTTGYTRNAIIHHGRLDPGVELIGKPFTYAALVDKIQRLLGP